jgi:biotin operon repressor
MTHPTDLSGDFDSLTAPRKFTGIWIPKEIYLRRDINALEKMLWSEIYSLDNEDVGGCYASEKYLCEFLGIKRTQLYEMLKHLRDLGLIIDVAFNGRVKVRKAIIPQLVKEDAGRQEFGNPDESRPETRTSPIIYKSKVDNKGIGYSKQSATAGTACPNPPKKKVIKLNSEPMKTFVSSDLHGDDLEGGTLTIPQAKWDQYIAKFGEAAVNRAATALSNFIVTTGRKYKSHYMALLTFLTNGDKPNNSKAPTVKGDFRHFESNGKFPKNPTILDL